MLQRVFGLLDAVGDVHHVGVDHIAAQILPECLAQLVVVFSEQRLDGFELRAAPLRRAGVAGKKILALPGDEIRESEPGIVQSFLYCLWSRAYPELSGRVSILVCSPRRLVANLPPGDAANSLRHALESTGLPRDEKESTR